MGKTYLCKLAVRGYELDGFGHVNHAVYFNYLEHARWELLEEAGIRMAELNAWKRWPVIAHLEATYLKPTYAGEKLEVRTRLASDGRVSFVADQEIFRGETVVFKAKVKVVMVNETGRPAEMPAEFSRLCEPGPAKTETP